MSEKEQQQWYTNKEIYEMVQELRADMAPLRTELRETAAAVKRYNGLRERIDATERKLSEHLMTGAGQATVARGIREWGGWIVAIASLLIALTR